jgi:hypothetical protein
MAAVRGIEVAARRLYGRNGRMLFSVAPAPLTAVDLNASPMRFTPLTSRERRTAQRAPLGLRRHVAWLQLYADVLHDAGVLGAGTVSVQFDPTLPVHVYAAAIPEHASIQLNLLARTRVPGRFEHGSLIHELLHLGQSAGGRDTDAVLEATIQLLTDAIGDRLQPSVADDGRYAFGLPLPYPAALALPLLHWKLHAAGAERRPLLRWLLDLYGHPVIASAQIEAFLNRLPLTDRQLIDRVAQAHVRRLPGRAQHCRWGGHGQCAHSLLSSFLLAFGSEWASYGTERDPKLARLRGGYPLPSTDPGYAATVARYAAIRSELLATS